MSDALNSSDVALSANALTLLPKILLAMPSVAHNDTAFSTAAQGNYMPRLMLGT